MSLIYFYSNFIFFFFFNDTAPTEIYTLSLPRRSSDPHTLEQVAAGYRAGGWPAQVDGDAFTADRKSTRLNSSHMSISYAVFCLKKKKKKIKNIKMKKKKKKEKL